MGPGVFTPGRQTATLDRVADVLASMGPGVFTPGRHRGRDARVGR